MVLHQYGKSIISGLATIIIAAIFITALAGVINEYGTEWFKPSTAPDQPSPSQVEQWNKAIAAANSRKALLLAEQMVKPGEISIPPIDYLMLFQRFNLPLPALTSDFSTVDLTRWRDALAARALHAKLTAGTAKPLEIIFNTIVRDIRPLEKPVSAGSIMEIWARHGGTPNDRFRLLAELARFSGYETTMVYLTDTKGMPFYALAELRRNDEYAVADILYERLYQGAPLENMSAPAEWHPEIKAALNRTKIYLIPAELSDYRNMENCLATALNHLRLLPDSPMVRLNELIRRKGKSSETRVYTFWGHPLEGTLTRTDIPPAWNPPIAKKP